jgi:hypothetical protein
MISYCVKLTRAFCLLFTENVRWLSLERNQNAGHIQPLKLGRKQHHQGNIKQHHQGTIKQQNQYTIKQQCQGHDKQETTSGSFFNQRLQSESYSKSSSAIGVKYK